MAKIATGPPKSFKLKWPLTMLQSAPNSCLATDQVVVKLPDYYNLIVLGEEAQVTAELSAQELDRLLDPAHYLGQARVWVARAVSEHQHFTA